jgi:hypothetical protein
MQLKSYLFLPFIALLFFSCQAQTSSDTTAQQVSWEGFWKNWQQAVASDDVKAVSELVRFPLIGAEHVGNNGQFNETDLVENYSKIISPYAKKEIANLPSQQLAKSAMNSEILSKLTGIAMGEELRIHSIKELQNEGTPQEKNVTIAYIFGLVDGVYQLVWLRIG